MTQQVHYLCTQWLCLYFPCFYPARPSVLFKGHKRSEHCGKNCVYSDIFVPWQINIARLFLFLRKHLGPLRDKAITPLFVKYSLELSEWLCTALSNSLSCYSCCCIYSLRALSLAMYYDNLSHQYWPGHSEPSSWLRNHLDCGQHTQEFETAKEGNTYCFFLFPDVMFVGAVFKQDSCQTQANKQYHR